MLEKAHKICGLLKSAKKASVGGRADLPGGWARELVDEINHSKNNG